MDGLKKITKTSVKVVGNSTEIRTGFLSNINLEDYSYTILFGKKLSKTTKAVGINGNSARYERGCL
jgi:hypothetical protein